MPVNFNTIRPFKNSANNAFEELCCQLARFEPIPAGSRFIRNGTPDGGVEAYWILPTSEEHGWQAKYFDRLENTQWQQLRESVATALRTHPNLTKYTICLPIDLPDARTEDQTSLRDKWNEKVKQWEAMAHELGRNVAFELWGASELTSRLAEEKHAGRKYFWFGSTDLSPQWFSRHLTEVNAAAGPRYSADLNVGLEISKKFEALAHTQLFKTTCMNVRLEFELALAKMLRGWQDNTQFAQKELVVVRDCVNSLCSLVEEFESDIPCKSSPHDLEISIQKTIRAAWSLQELLEKDASLPVALAKSELRELRTFVRSLDLIGNQLADTTRLGCVPALLLCGDAGSGKTHLMCDVANKHIELGYPTVVILGQLLGSGDLWSQIISGLQLNCTRAEFLGALESVAEAKGCRALILIDAINEAQELNWKDVLPAFLATLSNHPRIGVALSCRSTYEQYLVRADLVPKRLTRIEHEGFAGSMYEALSAFTSFYNLESLNVPPLDVEFENPLFLKLFCQGLKNRNLRRPPLGHNGLQTIFNSLIDSVNEKLADPSELDFRVEDPIVRRALDKIADAMLSTESNELLHEDAQRLLGAVFPQPGVGYSRTLLRKLIDEGILANGVQPRQGQETPDRVVYFAYERLADFHRANRLLDTCNTGNVPEKTDLSKALRHHVVCSKIDQNRGLLVALIVLVPERTGRELIEFIPDLRDWESFHSAFLEALPWRASKHISADCVALLESLLEVEVPQPTNIGVRDAALNCLLLLAANPDHKLNASWLHDKLSMLPMPKRDAFWTTFLHRSWTARKHASQSVKRLIAWGWKSRTHENCPCHDFDDEVILLSATALTWCFTASNRFVRDRATKALVCVLGNHAHLITRLLKKFESVDDPYVTERLMCSVYGAVLVSAEEKFLKPIALAVYEEVFANDQPCAHILIRDYARGIIEYAIARGYDLQLEPTSFRPPYRTEPISELIPSWEELRKEYSDSSHSGLMLSLWPTMGDFSRYVLGVDSHDVGIQGWTDGPDPFLQCRKQQVRELSEPLASRWLAISNAKILALFDAATVSESDDHPETADSSNTETDLLLDEPAQFAIDPDKFYASLTPDEQIEFQEYLDSEAVKARMLSEAESKASSQRLEQDFPARWIFLRVLSLGWTPERFAAFDDPLRNGDMRESHKAERIGKKYQWIAYHELFGRITDQRPLRHSYFEGTERFDGPWDHFLRDIDPTFLDRGTPVKSSNPCWWMPQTNPIDITSGISGIEWVLDRESLPDFPSFTSVARPHDSSKWLVLELSNTWQHSARQFVLTDEQSRELSFSIGAYFVPADMETAFAESMGQFNWTGHDVVSRDHHDFFLGEYGWAPSFTHYIRDAQQPLSLQAEHSQIRQFTPKAVGAFAVMSYYSEGNSFDCSQDEGCSACIPSAWLALRTGLRWARKRFRFEDAAGNVVAYDPSFEEPGPRALVVKADTILSLLKRSNFRLFWMLIGEKRLQNRSTQTTVFRQLYSIGGDGALNVHLRSFGVAGEQADSY